MKPTHTHRTDGGRFAELHRAQGSRRLEEIGTIIVYLDIDKQMQSAVAIDDWKKYWKVIEPDDCPVCLGAKHDQIKGNRDKPCGGCFGLGKVREDGETPTDLWELAAVANGIIQRQQTELAQLRPIAKDTEVQSLLIKRERQAIGRQEQAWRAGKGHGAGGQRHTGD